MFDACFLHTIKCVENMRERPSRVRLADIRLRKERYYKKKTP